MGVKLKNKNDDSIWELSNVIYHSMRSEEDLITLKPIQTKAIKSEITMTRKQFERGVAFGYWVILTS